jgi:hypothetical protein
MWPVCGCQSWSAIPLDQLDGRARFSIQATTGSPFHRHGGFRFNCRSGSALETSGAPALRGRSAIGLKVVSRSRRLEVGTATYTGLATLTSPRSRCAVPTHSQLKAVPLGVGMRRPELKASQLERRTTALPTHARGSARRMVSPVPISRWSTIERASRSRDDGRSRLCLVGIELESESFSLPRVTSAAKRQVLHRRRHCPLPTMAVAQ